MADINGPAPPMAVGWRARNGEGGQGGSRKRAFAQAVRAYGARVSAPPHDVTDFHGIPEAELTDAVRAALDDLMGEIDRLHWRLEQSEGRQAYLEGLADRESLLPVLNRRAFERDLALMLQTRPADGTAAVGALALFYLTNFETLHGDHGLEAAETALRHVAETLVAHLRPSDLVGALGGAGLAVALPMTGEAAARVKAEEMRTSVLAWAPRHGSRTLALDLAVAVVPLVAETTVAAALARADLALRQDLKDPPPAA